MNAPMPVFQRDSVSRLEALRQIERKLLWLSAWMVHQANHVRPNRDGLKVGGHQASCASVISIMTALYFDRLRPQDRVAVKPHASPVFHAANYLFGRQRVAKMEGLRQFGGAQAYPSRVKDGPEVDFSTGSVGLGVAITSFASLIQDYVRLHGLADESRPAGRHIAIAGDAELDEGNIYEALLEGWKHDVRNVWWIVDYNRQSLDSVVQDRLFGRSEGLFGDMGWNVVRIKHGRAQQAAFARPGGEALRAWIDECPNSQYAALTFQGGAAWRAALLGDLGRDAQLRKIIDPLTDDELSHLMTNLGGHDIETLLEAFAAAEADGDKPTCFIAYTIKGMGLPFAGHKDNHSGLMTAEQMSPKGQHIELGIAEQNLFLLLGAAGLSHSLYGARLLPIGTVYDPFVNRGLDALIYACYQDARFLLVSTPSGITLAPEGGQHQSVNTPLIGMALDRLASFEPAYVDELAILMRHAFAHMQAPDGSAVWLRLSTRGLAQKQRTLDPTSVIAGAHWVVEPEAGAPIALAYQGPVAPEAEAAFEALREDVPNAGLLAITSPDRLHAGWLTALRARRRATAAQSHIEKILAPLAPGAALVTVLDGHPASLAWLGGVAGQRVIPMGVDRFGQSADLPDIYQEYQLDTDAILDACAQALLSREPARNQ
jgi:pyruvate dehydrogenase complex dehydrogenase (E1) component